MQEKAELTFDEWFARYCELAHERELHWLVTEPSALQREAYGRGVGPDEEIDALGDMAQWRGCRCRGG